MPRNWSKRRIFPLDRPPTTFQEGHLYFMLEFVDTWGVETQRYYKVRGSKRFKQEWMRKLLGRTDAESVRELTQPVKENT